MRTALKEWAVVVQALERGEQVLLLRKGGLADRGGVFRPEHDRFLLYPTHEHQRPDLLKEAYRAAAAEPVPASQAVRFTSHASLGGVFPVKALEQLESLDGEHIWSVQHVRARWEYKPDRPLLALTLRVYRLLVPQSSPFHARYTGCRSWVPLEADVPTEPSVAALDEDAFGERQERIRRALG